MEDRYLIRCDNVEQFNIIEMILEESKVYLKSKHRKIFSVGKISQDVVNLIEEMGVPIILEHHQYDLEQKCLM